MANTKVYIHEYIDIIGHNRTNYMHHMTANFSPTAQEQRQQLCYGVWGTVGTTRRWPEVINLWEEQGFGGLASSFRHEFNHTTLQDPFLAQWWARAAQFRRSGEDRVLVPAEWTRTIEELCATVASAETYAHEMVQLRPGTAWHFIDNLVRDEAQPVYNRFGWELIGAFVTAMKNDSEALVLWAIPTWEQWSDFEQVQRTDKAVKAWRERAMTVADDWHRILLVNSPLCPLRTLRQPRVEDRASHRLPDDPE